MCSVCGPEVPEASTTRYAKTSYVEAFDSRKALTLTRSNGDSIRKIYSMRLLNIYTGKVQEFFEKDVPPYCILSHRWGENEVSYKDYCKGRNLDGLGYRKILEFCNVVRNRRWWESRFPTATDGSSTGSDYGEWRQFEWVWIDTCTKTVFVKAPNRSANHNGGLY